MTFESYLATLRGKQVAVIGIGVSNIPLIKLFLKKGIAVTACDKCERDNYDNQPLLQELETLGATLHMGAGYLDDLTQDVIFRSPGIRPDILAFGKRQATTSIWAATSAVPSCRTLSPSSPTTWRCWSCPPSS